MSVVNVRPSLVLVLGSMLLSACTATTSSSSSYAPPLAKSFTRTVGPERDAGDEARDQAVASRPASRVFDYNSVYSSINDDGIAIPAFDYTKMNSKYLRRHVPYYGPERPGTIVVDAGNRLLYLVEANGMAMRYGIAVGKEGFGWTGNAILQWKQKWPTWTPPAEMIERNPSLKKYADGLKGSPANPLGARAMYLFKGGKDTMYRIHGTTKPYSIGKAASSGCFRMINQDVIDLYSRVGRKNSVQVRTRLAKNVVQLEGGI
ncbi:MAG: L,D-transpeptidase [Rhizobiaceae bacterium]